MLKVGEQVKHISFGIGEITKCPNQFGFVIVAFENEFEILMGKVTDTDHFFEDDRRLEKTHFIEVHTTELIKMRSNSNHFLKDRNPNCHSCGKLLSPLTHRECKNCNNWLMCDCGSCGCNYIPR